MLDPTECARALAVAEELAEEAGKLVLEGWRGRAQVSLKGKFDLLTEYDLKSEALVRGGLQRSFPSHRIVGES